MESVLSNPLLLQEIITKFPSDFPIKKYRRVSKFWNNIIISLPQPRLRLVVNPLHIPQITDPTTFINFTQAMEPKLARCIGITKATTLHNLTYTNIIEIEAAAYINMKQCIIEFSEQIQFIDLKWNYVRMKFIGVLHQLFCTYCPNLTSLTVKVKTMEEDEDFRKPENLDLTWRDLDFSSFSEFPVKSRLVYIDVDLLENTMTHTLSGILHNFYENLVKAAPNLIKIRQTLLSFPDLNTSQKLKTLSFSLPIFVRDFVGINRQLSVNFKLYELNRMLTQVSTTLEFLTLSIDHFFCGRYDEMDCNCASQLGFIMPSLPRLISLTCHDIDLFLPSNPSTFFQKLNKYNKLTCIEIGRVYSEQDGGISSWIQSFCTSFIARNLAPANTVKHVQIDGVYNFDPLLEIHRPFPNIQSLLINKDFKTKGAMFDISDPYGQNTIICQFARALQICSNLTFLSDFDVLLSLPRKFHVFVQVLHDNIQLFRAGGLKNLRIKGTGSPMDMDYHTYSLDELEVALMSMQDMKSVKIQNSSVVFPWHIAMRICGFIVANNLPVAIR